MNRFTTLLVLFIFGLFSLACRKEIHSSAPNADPLIEKAKEYFNSAIVNLPTSLSNNPRAAAAKTVNWDQAAVVSLSIGKAVLVPVKYEKDLFIRTTQGGQNNFHLSNLTQLLVYQSKGAFHAEVVTGFPDTNYLQHPEGAFSGMVYVEDWAGNSLAKYLYEGRSILKYADPGPSALPGSSPVQSLNVISIEVCYQIVGYNYSTASPSEGYAWSEAPVCRPSMVPADIDPIAVNYGNVAAAGGSIGVRSSTTGIVVAGGTNPIKSISNYLQCFTNSGGNDHHYTVTVLVNQPEPGSRTPWVITSGGPAGSYYASNPVSVGHTFLAFTEQYGGITITRNIGFYPSSFVKPGYTSTRGLLNNDESHDYNISATFQVTNADFFNMLSYISDASPGLIYNLNSENCTTFALQTLYQGGIDLPKTIGTWAGGGMGNDPGDLGEDIRNMNLLPNMTRTTSPSYHFNVGVCN